MRDDDSPAAQQAAEAMFSFRDGSRWGGSRTRQSVGNSSGNWKHLVGLKCLREEIREITQRQEREKKTVVGVEVSRLLSFLCLKALLSPVSSLVSQDAMTPDDTQQSPASGATAKEPFG